MVSVTSSLKAFPTIYDSPYTSIKQIQGTFTTKLEECNRSVNERVTKYISLYPLRLVFSLV